MMVEIEKKKKSVNMHACLFFGGWVGAVCLSCQSFTKRIIILLRD
jgi:hypothetical protein